MVLGCPQMGASCWPRCPESIDSHPAASVGKGRQVTGFCPQSEFTILLWKETELLRSPAVTREEQGVGRLHGEPLAL